MISSENKKKLNYIFTHMAGKQVVQTTADGSQERGFCFVQSAVAYYAMFTLSCWSLANAWGLDDATLNRIAICKNKIGFHYLSNIDTIVQFEVVEQ